MCEEDRAYNMSVKHFLIVSNSVWTQQPFALLYTSMDTVNPPAEKKKHAALC